MFSLYSLGEAPICFLKTVEKYNGSTNPDKSATFLTESSPLSKSETANFKRSDLKYSEYEIPIFSLKRWDIYFELYESSSDINANDKSGSVNLSSEIAIILFIKAFLKICLCLK